MSSLIKYAKKLRKEMTEAEKTLWYILQSKNLRGLKFRRQESIGQYIVDFVCFSKKLVIELDGGQHAEVSQHRDIIRDSWLKSQGFKVIRFWNNEVLNNRDGVVEEIIKYLSPSPISPPIKGGGKSSFLIDREKLNSGKSKDLRRLRDLR